MDKILWGIFSVAIIIIILGILFIIVNRKKKYPTDYYNLFVMGIIWTAIGIPLENFALSAMGIIFLVIGLVHKKEWKKNRRSWKKLSKEERKIKIILIIGLTILLILGLVAFLFMEYKRGIIIGGDKDAHGCLIAAGYSWCPSTEKCQRMWEEYCVEFKEQFRIKSFEDCAKVTGTVMESYPRQCNDGTQTWVEEI